MPLDADKLGNLDPKLAWALIALAFATSFLLPLLLAKLNKGGKPSDDTPSPAVPATVVPSAAVEVRHIEKPSLDAQSQLLIQMVENLEKRAERAEQRNEAQQKQFEEQRREMQKRIDDLEGQLFAAQRTSDQQRQEIDTLRAEVRQLTQQLIARGSGG